MKEHDKNTKQKTYKMGRKSMAGKTSRTCTVGTKMKQNNNFFKFQFEIAFNGYLDKFLS